MQDEAHGRHRTHPNTQHITIRLREHLYTLCSHRQPTESKPKSAHDRMSRLSTDRAKKIHMRKPTPEPVQTILSNGRGHVVAHTARRAGTEVGKGWSCGLLCLGHGGGRESERTGQMHSTTKRPPTIVLVGSDALGRGYCHGPSTPDLHEASTSSAPEPRTTRIHKNLRGLPIRPTGTHILGVTQAPGPRLDARASVLRPGPQGRPRIVDSDADPAILRTLNARGSI